MVFLTIWKTIHPKITNNIRYLYIGFIGACMSDLLPLLIDSIPSLLQLETLIVAEELMMDCDGIYSKIHQSNIPTIRSESLKKLSMTCNYRYTVDLPQLEIFEGALSVLNLPDGCSQSLILPNLKQLHVLVMNDDSINPTVFRRMPCLNFIRWDVPLDEALFIAICETCPSLTVLHLYKELIFTDLSLFDHLRKLAGLRRLSFPAINKQLFYDFSKFNHLEELNFGNNEILAVTLLSLPKSVRKLGLLVYPINERNLMEIIACSLTKLTELQLIFYGGSASQEMLKMLPSLKQLKVLWLGHCYFSRSFFLGMDVPLPQLRILRFLFCKLDTMHLLGLQEKFPNVKNPEFVQCYESLIPDVGELVSAFPRLAT